MKDKICGYYLDEQQQHIVLDESKYLLVVAGAGSGKTFTILGKIYYLTKYKHVLPSEILCISFTKSSSISLKKKIEKELKIDIPVYTFHKLSLEILKNKFNDYEITSNDTLNNIIHLFFYETVLQNEKLMHEILQYFKVKSYKNIIKKYANFIRNNTLKIEKLEILLLTFIHLFKCNNYDISDFSTFLTSIRRWFNFKYKQEKIFLLLALNIYLLYQNHLNENKEIDFDDMIINATKYVKEGANVNKYKYVIIDEYQDTSFIRFDLIKSILDVTSANLMVVGDDFQSIYRFTGCDVSLFLNFQEYFNDAKILKIENTYRNSQELVDIASRFVLKNKYQIRKKLKSSKHLLKPVSIVYYKNIKKAFLTLVRKIYSKTRSPILVIGRNNKDINLVISSSIEIKNDEIIVLNNSNIKLKYMTAHKSKGLEEENVIIINLIDGMLGFPNKIKDDRVLRFVSKNYDNYLYGEERRLFYVALTRTKNKVYLLTPLKDKSTFVRELIADNYRKIEIIKL